MILFVAGIDTGIGKTIDTGLMARWYAARGISVAAVIYNLYHTARPEIVCDTCRVIGSALRHMGYATPILDTPLAGPDAPPEVNFSGLLSLNTYEPHITGV